jgi:hypothetical protein
MKLDANLKKFLCKTKKTSAFISLYFYTSKTLCSFPKEELPLVGLLSFFYHSSGTPTLFKSSK